MNNSITEDHCSFEVSKLLKEKGFAPRESSKIFVLNKGEILEFNGEYTNAHLLVCDEATKGWQENFHRPTHPLAIKWIRENFEIICAHTMPVKLNGVLLYGGKIWEEDKEPIVIGSYNSPEEAIESALLYTLKNLI